MAFFNKKSDKQKATQTAPPAQETKHDLPKGGDAQSYRLIKGPHVTEKASNGNALGKYVFRISSSANKIEIKQGIEKLYKTKVQSVHMIHVPAKSRQVGRYRGEKSAYKKAVVTLKHGEKL